jgi:hypothetical protein
VLKVGEAAFYAWQKGKTYRLSQKKSEMAQAVKEVFYLHRRRYGARRISAELKADGLTVGRRLAGSLMRKQSLTAICPKRFVPRTTDSKHDFGYKPESIEGGGRAAGERTSDRRRYYIFAASKRKVLLSGNFPG